MKRTFGTAPDGLRAEVEKFFEKEGWSMQPLGDRFTLGTRFGGEQGDWTCVAWIPDEKNLFVFYSIFPEEIPETAYPACSEFVCRANFGMLIGAFEFDLDKGELRFRTSANLEGVSSAHHLLQHLVYTNIVTMDRYYPAIQEITGGANVVAVLEKYEEA